MIAIRRHFIFFLLDIIDSSFLYYRLTGVSGPSKTHHVALKLGCVDLKRDILQLFALIAKLYLN